MDNSMKAGLLWLGIMLVWGGILTLVGWLRK